MTGKEFKEQFWCPMVYCWKRGEEYLYVGKSKSGFSRLVNYDKHDVLKRERIEDADSIEIFFFHDNEECLAYERYMIKEYKPKYNFKQGRKLSGEKDKISTLWMEFGN